MTGFVRGLAAGAALGLSLGCGSSTPQTAAAGAQTSNGGAAETNGGPDTSGGTTAYGGATASGGASSNTAGSGSGSGSVSNATHLAAKLGRSTNFLIGLGNDLDPNSDHDQDGAFRLGTTLDLHYAYLSAYMVNGAWSSWDSWNPDGGFVDVITKSANDHGVVPMLTLYAMAAYGSGVLTGMTDDTFEKDYWDDVKLLFQHLGTFDKPAVVHLEPDFWAYAEQQSKEDPTSMKVNLTANAPDCADLSNDLVGMGQCLVKLARIYAPKTLIGFHASQWAASDPNATVTFLKKVGADQADIIFADLLDRDAGCYEAATDPACMRGGGMFYWDESNTTSPNFHDYLSWSKTIASGLGLPMLWWQIPLGVPSTTPGGTSGHYRDNRVHYLFSHIQEFVDAGGLGAAFGVGSGNQTTIDTDGGQFKNAVAGYYKSPTALP
jgi:hypothetical protein